MTITLDRVLKWFYHITMLIMVFGTVLLIIDNEVDIYAVWVAIAMVVGSYLIESK